jgi:hypothetical protein
MDDLVHDLPNEIRITDVDPTLTILVDAKFDVPTRERIDLVLEEEQGRVDL